MQIWLYKQTQDYLTVNDEMIPLVWSHPSLEKWEAQKWVIEQVIRVPTNQR